MDKQLQQARSARTAAAWTAAIVMIAGAVYGTITGNDTLAFVIFFVIGGLGIFWFLWLNERVSQLEKAYKDRDPVKDQDIAPPQPQPSSATDPTVVVAVIGLVGTILAVLLAR